MQNRVVPKARGEELRRRKPRHHRLLGLPPPAWKVVQDYCQQSSLHGLKYISNPDLPYIERYIWLGVFIASVGFAFHLIMEVWVFWREKPFLITFDSATTPIWSIPFPSITICSYFAVKRSALDLAATENRTALFFASMVCPMDSLRSKVPELEYVGNEFYDFVKQVSPACNDILKRCSFHRQEISCCDIFDPIVTESGLCYIFNNLPLNRILTNRTFVPFPSKKYPDKARFWNPDEGYPKPDLRGQNNSFTYPLWVQVAGEGFGLSVELFQNITEWQNECSGAFSGFKIIMSNPAELPIFSKVSVRVSMNRESSLMLNPSSLNSRQEMVAVQPSIRACVFNSEHPLRYFSQYYDTSCSLECSSVQFIQQCGCVPFFYPREENIRICSRRKDDSCLKRAKAQLTALAMEIEQQQTQVPHPCRCHNGCQKVLYRSADFYTDFIYSGRDPPWANGHLRRDQVTKVSVYFRGNQFLGRHRAIRYTNLKFAGTCGGLLSLMLGFSVISVIEIVYAFVLRPFSRYLHGLCGPPAQIKSEPQISVAIIRVEPASNIITGQYHRATVANAGRHNFR